MMRVPTGGFYDRAALGMGKLAARADVVQTQIATGKRLAAPSDDALAYRTLSGFKRQDGEDLAYRANMNLAAGALAQADTTLTAITDQLQRASELAIRAGTGTMTADARRAIGIELAGIVETLAGLANRTDVRGLPLFGGANGEAAAVRGPDGSFTLAGTSPSAIPIGAEGQSVQASESARRVFGFTGRNGPTDALAVVAALAAAIQAGDETGAAARGAIDDLTGATEQVANAQASLGARAARVEIMGAQLAELAADREEARGGLEDTDIATAVTELQKTMTILSATQASFAKLSSLSLFSYLR